MQLFVNPRRETCNAVKQPCCAAQPLRANALAALPLSQLFYLVMCVGAACKAHLVPLVCI